MEVLPVCGKLLCCWVSQMLPWHGERQSRQALGSHSPSTRESHLTEPLISVCPPQIMETGSGTQRGSPFGAGSFHGRCSGTPPLLGLMGALSGGLRAAASPAGGDGRARCCLLVPGGHVGTAAGSPAVLVLCFFFKSFIYSGLEQNRDQKTSPLMQLLLPASLPWKDTSRACLKASMPFASYLLQKLLAPCGVHAEMISSVDTSKTLNSW